MKKEKEKRKGKGRIKEQEQKVGPRGFEPRLLAPQARVMVQPTLRPQVHPQVVTQLYIVIEERNVLKRLLKIKDY